ncbi:MAG: hypothetical protein UR60_C0008G0011 [Candidatus Moranbacteria bacterium GW2011_GWF2_34_56]|nr:MAG: hypothetical protein UR51_C0002G0109 [Candidatus Moranbacteria bacterium GW2011_GWF1_34_10]KKP65139.1 MAG: hypothetical protein UR60_C0008G0011 [Candidatus Moranbacteria bacterium GW2011_GWF2_34_56]
MPDEKIISSSLEPIGENDLDLSNKFGHVEGGAKGGSVEEKKENIISPAEKESANEISGAEKDSAYNQILSKIPQQTSDSDDKSVKEDALEVSVKMDAESQIQHLLDLATTRGVVHAIKVAKHMDDNYVLDMLHDKMISDEFHKILLEKNLINQD